MITFKYIQQNRYDSSLSSIFIHFQVSARFSVFFLQNKVVIQVFGIVLCTIISPKQIEKRVLPQINKAARP